MLLTPFVSLDVRCFYGLCHICTSCMIFIINNRSIIIFHSANEDVDVVT